MLTRKDLARLFQVCVRTIDNWVRDGRLPPPQHFGRSLRWADAAIRPYLEDDMTPSQNPTSNEGERIHAEGTTVRLGNSRR